jgi:hypothetical protein
VSYQSDINPRHSTWRKVRHTLSIVSHEPANLLGALLLMLFSWIILAPVMSVLLNAVLVQSGDEGRTGATEGTFTVVSAAHVNITHVRAAALDATSQYAGGSAEHRRRRSSASRWRG